MADAVELLDAPLAPSHRGRLMKRVCSGCGVITSNRRCADCQRTYEASRARADYGAAWRKLQARAIREQPWCSVCHSGGTLDNPLTGDHITPWRRGGRNERGNVQVLCKRCNSSKGARQSIGGA
jgi:5-methylcytosine-specific restriction protein A